MLRFSNKEKNHMMDLLFTLALFCVFAASSLMVVLIGANVYKNTVDGMNDNYDTRTSLTYIAEKLNQNDTAAGVRLDQLDGKQALVISQELDGSAYETWIYHQEGKLKELFIQAGNEKQVESGQPIMDVKIFFMEDLGNGMFRFRTVNSKGANVELVAGVNCFGT